jgi:hypothetical protein
MRLGTVSYAWFVAQDAIQFMQGVKDLEVKNGKASKRTTE